MQYKGGLNVPDQSEKIKIKLSELTDMYDIENDSSQDKDTENIPEKKIGNAEIDEHEEELETAMEDEFNNA